VDRSTSADTRRLMLIEDDVGLRTTLAQILRDEGLEVAPHTSGEEALEHFDDHDPDLAIVDVRLPGMSGFDVVGAIRARSDIPIIILTAQTDRADVVAGLEAGADDYMTKPFVVDELLARIRANLRRFPQGPAESGVLRCGDLVVSPATAEVTVAGRAVPLTRTELRVLAVLAEADGAVVSREQLLARVWHYDYLGDSRMVDAHVRRLRLKIERDPADPRRLVTVRGSGYRLVPGDASSSDS
jgi:DNA-binding response OmpR family regulator